MLLTRSRSLTDLHEIGREFAQRRRERQRVPLEVVRKMVKGSVIAGFLLHRLPFLFR